MFQRVVFHFTDLEVHMGRVKVTLQAISHPVAKIFWNTHTIHPGVKQYTQSTMAISNVRYLEFRGISNFFLGPFSIYGLLSYKMSRYLEFRYLEIISFFVPRKNYSRCLKLFSKCSSQKPIHERFFLCVRARVFNRMLCECFFS